MNVHENVARHIDIVGGVLVADSAYPVPEEVTDTDLVTGENVRQDGASLQAVTFDVASELERMTSHSHKNKPEPNLEIVAITALEQVEAAVERINANSEQGVPTVVIDFVGKGQANVDVAEALLNSPHTGRALGYSAWNTPGNKIGIAVGMGQSRYAFITKETNASALQEAMNAQGSLLFKRFLKDYYYKAVAIADIRTYSRAHALYTNVATLADQNMLLFNSSEDYEHLQSLLRDLMQTYTTTLAAKPAFAQGNDAVVQLEDGESSYAAYEHAELEYTNPDFIWGRAFEITLNPQVTLVSV
ncbi:DUF4127 family protein [Bacillales bacterium AN1005]